MAKDAQHYVKEYGMSTHDSDILVTVKRRAYNLDEALFCICGVRFGWGSVIGLVPVIGDILDALLAALVLKTCRNVHGGLPVSLQIRMIINIASDFLVGLVPFAGDFLDAMYKVNTRNAKLLENHLSQKGKSNRTIAGELS